MTQNSRESKAYDTLKGFIYAAAPTSDVKHFIERELDILYESWYRLRDFQESAGVAESKRKPVGLQDDA